MKRASIIILALVIPVAIFIAGCTTTSPATSPGTGTTVKPTTSTTSGIKYATVWPTATGVLTGTGSLYGKITKEGTDKVALPNAVIYIWKEENAYDEDKVPAFAKAVTDANGEYKISNIPFGYYKIRVTPPNEIGYHDSDIVNIDGAIEWNNEE